MDLMLERGLNLHDPRYIGHQVPPRYRWPACSMPWGRSPTGDGHLRDGPWATASSRPWVQRTRLVIGWTPGSFAGVGDARRLVGQPHGVAHRAQRSLGRRVGTGHIRSGSPPRPSRPCRRALQRGLARPASWAWAAARSCPYLGCTRSDGPVVSDAELTACESRDIRSWQWWPAPAPPRWDLRPSERSRRDLRPAPGVCCTSTPPMEARRC